MGKTGNAGMAGTGTSSGIETNPPEETADKRPNEDTPETGAFSAGDKAGTGDGDEAGDKAGTGDGDEAGDKAGTGDGDEAGDKAGTGDGDAVEVLTADRDKWRALARKNEDRAKANAAAAQALKDVEAERDALKADNEARGSREGDLEAENSRLLAALKHGLAESDLRFLKGVPADEIDAAAADLAARVGRTPGGRERFLGRETPPGSGPGAGGDFLRQAMTARHI